MSQSAQNQCLRDTRRLPDERVTLVMRLVSRCILRSKDYFADPFFNGARCRCLALAKIAKKGVLARRRLRAKTRATYLFSIGTYFDG